MSIPCEIAVKCVLPSVRAMLAKELVTKHKMNQAEAAKLLGVSQPAVSLYCRRIRGKALDLETDAEISKSVEDMAVFLVEHGFSHKEFVLRFCGVCRAIRAKGLLCKLHEILDPTIDIENCQLCMAASALRCL
jgi:predicted transcriptional regulator